MREVRNSRGSACGEAVEDERRPASTEGPKVLEPKAEGPKISEHKAEGGQHVSALPPLFLARFCEAWVHAGMCTVGVSLMERDKR